MTWPGRQEYASLSLSPPGDVEVEGLVTCCLSPLSLSPLTLMSEMACWSTSPMPEYLDGSARLCTEPATQVSEPLPSPCLGPYGGPRGEAVSYERGTPVVRGLL